MKRVKLIKIKINWHYCQQPLIVIYFLQSLTAKLKQSSSSSIAVSAVKKLQEKLPAQDVLNYFDFILVKTTEISKIGD